MMWVDILVALILFFSLIGGLKEGAVKRGFSVLTLLIAIPVAATFFRLPATLLSFLPRDDWNNFIGFFITLAFITAILHIAFFLPRRIVQKTWNKGLLFRLTGGALNVLNSAIGMVVFALVVRAYPIIDWLERAVTESSALTWLVNYLSFVEAWLAKMLQSTAITVFTGPILTLVSQISFLTP
ncbi:CvpA family protein [Chloroflexota bacterium]